MGRAQLPDEVTLDVAVLVIEPRQLVGVQLAVAAHERELEEAEHRRRENVCQLAVLLERNHHPLVRQFTEDRTGLLGRLLPDAGDLLERYDLEWQKCTQSCLFLGDEELDDLAERLREVDSRNVLLQAACETSIAVLTQVTHATLLHR